MGFLFHRKIEIFGIVVPIAFYVGRHAADFVQSKPAVGEVFNERCGLWVIEHSLNLFTQYPGIPKFAPCRQSE